MWTPPRIVRGTAVFLLFALVSCADKGPLDPGQNTDVQVLPPAAAVIDGSTTGNADFYFLPPLVNNPTIEGTFNPNLLPTVRVCELSAGACDLEVAYFGEGSVEVGDGQYQLNWDTDGPETAPLNPALFYRLEIAVGGELLGSIDLDPQDPDGPGQATSGYYAFRVGENIPVKFWLGLEVLCVGSDYVVECITGAVLDESGGTLSLDNEGDRLSVFLPPNGLPGENHPPITVVLERLDPDDFLTFTGEECIPLFDAPQFGPCFRITTYPELTGELESPALVSICVDPTQLPVNLPEEQEDQLQIVRFGNDGVLEGLANVPGDCPTSSASLMEVPDKGFMRYAALGVNALARVVGPAPLAAHGDITLGGLTSSFSRFRFALPGDMVATQGDGTLIQDGDPNTVPVQIQVLDYQGVAVENAQVHIATDDGSVSVTDGVSDANGYVDLTWTVDDATPGDKTLTASATGLFADGVPGHDGNTFFTEQSLTVTVTVVGPPSALNPSPTTALEGTAGESVGTVSINVTDDGGNPVAGATVTWSPSGDGSAAGSATTGADGSASADWTLSTTAGGNTLGVTVGGQSHTFNATGAAGPAVQPAFSGDGQSADAGYAVADPLVVTVADQHGNPREGDVVTWTVTSGGGSLSSAEGVTGADGTASASWTLGQTAGDNTVTAEVAGFTTTFNATGNVGAAVQPTGSGDGQTGTVGEALATSITITVTDEFGNAREGDAVSWTGDGSFDGDAATGADGTASVTWTLGTAAGTQSATATVGSFTVSFTATAQPGAAANLAVSGDGQTAYVGQTLANPLSVTVTDTHGNAREGDAVTWTTADGSVTGDAATDANGSAAGSWTLGAMPGSQSATVNAGGLEHIFSATAECFDGYGVATVDGQMGAAEWACADSASFEANISGGSTPAEVYWMNDADNLYLAVRVFQSSFDKANSVRFDFDNDGDGAAAENDDAIGYNVDTGAFIDEWLTKKCLNNSQSGCGEADSSKDGAGAAANDGTWTTYELSHPLNGGDPKDIARAAGQDLGLFLTLSVGKGAQGNTQWPAFRLFHIISIVGM